MSCVAFLQPIYSATTYGVGGPVGPQDIVSSKKSVDKSKNK